MGRHIGLADPATKLSFGYVMNKMFSGGANDPLVATYAESALTADQVGYPQHAARPVVHL
jgi:hypothetical protein